MNDIQTIVAGAVTITIIIAAVVKHELLFKTILPFFVGLFRMLHHKLWVMQRYEVLVRNPYFLMRPGVFETKTRWGTYRHWRVTEMYEPRSWPKTQQFHRLAEGTRLYKTQAHRMKEHTTALFQVIFVAKSETAFPFDRGTWVELQFRAQTLTEPEIAEVLTEVARYEPKSPAPVITYRR